MSRLTTAHLAVLALLAPGCFLSHEPAAITTAYGSFDAGTTARDASAATDAGFVPAPACAIGSGAITVSIEAVASPTRCTATHLDDFAVLGVDAEPGANGIRIHGDYCPSADADCRCDIVVGGVGTDVASSLPANGALALDLSYGESSAAPFVAIRRTTAPLCDCPTCPCSLDVYFYAADAEPALAPAVPTGLAFSVGGLVCRTGRCPMDVSLLHASVVGRETDLAVGADQSIASVRLRAVRDAQTVCDPCPSCGGGPLVGPARAAWAAWPDTELRPD